MKELYEFLINEIQEFVSKNNINGFVIGISGGKDSTIVAKLLVNAIGVDKVIGVSMPNGIQSDIDYVHKVFDVLNIKRLDVNINKQFDAIIDGIEDYNDFHLTNESVVNIAPRIRMTTLYAIAQSMGYLVAGTGNLSESYIGYFTKFGDGGHDFNPIGSLTCSEVIRLGLHMNIPDELVLKVPTDGLKGKSDEESFGFSYENLDKYIRFGTTDDSELDLKIKILHNNTSHKRTTPYKID